MTAKEYREGAVWLARSDGYEPRLPALAEMKGWRLFCEEVGWSFRYVIYDRFGAIIHSWPDGFLPDWVDALEVCTQLDKEATNAKH